MDAHDFDHLAVASLAVFGLFKVKRAMPGQGVGVSLT